MSEEQTKVTFYAFPLNTFFSLIIWIIKPRQTWLTGKFKTTETIFVKSKISRQNNATKQSWKTSSKNYDDGIDSRYSDGIESPSSEPVEYFGILKSVNKLPFFLLIVQESRGSLRKPLWT